MKNVLHIWRYYGQRSQTWLYRQLSAHTNYTPHLLLKPQWLHNANPSEFPFPPEQLHYFPHHNIIHRAISRAITSIITGRRNNFTISDIHDIKQCAKKIDAKIIHIHFGWTATKLFSINSSSFIVHPSSFIIVSFYGSDVFRLSPTYKKQLIKLLQTNIKIIVTSHALKVGLIEIGATPESITVIPVGISIDDFPSIDEITAAKTKQNNQPLKIFSVGRLIDCKAPHKLPEIARQLKDKGIDFQWTVAGDGLLMEKCKEAVAKFNIQDCFTLTGSISFKEVKQYMLNSGILVHNAIIAPDGSREALGVTLMEAGALGLPVISCNIGGIPEVIIDTKTGILVESEKPEAICTAIIKLANNPELRQQMGQTAMQHIRKNFNAATLTKKVEAMYCNLVVNN